MNNYYKSIVFCISSVGVPGSGGLKTSSTSTTAPRQSPTPTTDARTLSRNDSILSTTSKTSTSRKETTASTSSQKKNTQSSRFVKGNLFIIFSSNSNFDIFIQKDLFL